jgi:hypothetical protein
MIPLFCNKDFYCSFIGLLLNCSDYDEVPVGSHGPLALMNGLLKPGKLIPNSDKYSISNF